MFNVEVNVMAVVIYNLGKPYQASGCHNPQVHDMIISQISSQLENAMNI
jgi:hypothetical protein